MSSASEEKKTLCEITRCGKPLRALTTKCVLETNTWPRTELGYGKNVKDWAIRRIMSKSATLGYDRFSETEW